MQDTIPSTIQDSVDQYMELQKVYKQLEERMKELREEILTYMKENEVEHIRDTNCTGKVQLTVTERAAMTSKYTTYDAEELATLLEPELLEKCLIEVVDKDKLEALSKLGEISPEILTHKVTKSTYSLNVRFDK